ncbi:MULTISPECIES: MTH1187 family thiamine-binding protein [Paenibacillus]|uniref:MTH1187 family thiamine-binding protein n=1 Tax=Paenibacillus TaxID=44249 RepID=UPI00204172EB|nr:MTH1187 family thiamine-binding protein [Paenibacillus camelliae]
MANALLSIQMIPKTNNGESVIPYVDQAIAIIKESGVPYRVAPLETTMEGNLDELLRIVQRMHEAMTEAGCPGALSQIKISYNPQGASMDKLLEKYPDGQ